MFSDMKMFPLLLVMSSFSLASGQPHQPCLASSPADRKQFYHLGRQREVVINTPREESRWGFQEKRRTLSSNQTKSEE